MHRFRDVRVPFRELLDPPADRLGGVVGRVPACVQAEPDLAPVQHDAHRVQAERRGIGHHRGAAAARREALRHERRAHLDRLRHVHARGRDRLVERQPRHVRPVHQHQRVPRQFADLHVGPAGQRVVARDVDGDPHVDEPPGRPVGGRRHGGAPQVRAQHPGALEHRDRLAFERVDHRMARPVFGDERRQRPDDRRERRDHPPPRAADLVQPDGVAGHLLAQHQVPRRVEEPPAGVRQAQRAVAPLEQGDAELLFQRAELPGHRRLRDVQAP
ncbi:hypothetical protein ACFWQL_16850 [Amycolatopsis thermoflava]|uniref:hypothetical protein n=1 Tax=Amycolatopsis thermoflava TaxID=84480 RepID=UPI00365DAD1C